MRQYLPKVLALAVVCALPANAAVFTYTPNVSIPDNSSVGITDAHAISGLGSSISDVILTVNLTSGYVNDLLGYIRLGDQVDSPSYSLDSTLALNNPSFSIHLDSFQGLDPNSTWTLKLADMDPLGTTTLQSWSLDITAVPEPTTVALWVFGLALAVVQSIKYLRQRENLA